MGWIFSITFVLCIALWFFFRKANHALTQVALEKEAILERQINISQCQITTRQLHLNKYHFLRYNLSEALIPQPEIKL